MEPVWPQPRPQHGASRPPPAHLWGRFLSDPGSFRWKGSTVPEKKVRKESTTPSDSTSLTVAATSEPGSRAPGGGMGGFVMDADMALLGCTA